MWKEIDGIPCEYCKYWEHVTDGTGRCKRTGKAVDWNSTCDNVKPYNQK